MRLYLIRHGETPFNHEGRIQGYGEVPLSDKGIAQAARLGRAMADLGLDRIVASDLRRAAMTACILAAHTGSPLTWDPAFRERNPGELAGKPHEETTRFFTDDQYLPPGGEGVPAFTARVAAAFETLVAAHGGGDERIALVSHGLVCRAFMEVCLGRSRGEDAAMSFPNTCVTTADYEGGWKLVTLVDASHLDGPEDPSAHPTGA